MSQPVPSLLRRSALGLGLVLLSGCGFALRKPPRYAFRTVYLVTPGPGVRAVIKRTLEANPDVRVLDESADRQTADVILEIQSETREKVVAGLNAAGQVREFQLRLRLRFRLRTPRGLELIASTELLAEREIGFAESAALAKAEEEEILFRDMRQDLQQQMVRRLGAVRDLNTPVALPPAR